MNKKSIFLLALILTSGVQAFSQDKKAENNTLPIRDFRNIYKFSISEFTRNTFEMGYERFVAPSTSLYLIVGLTSKDDDWESIFGVRTEMQLKIHAYTSSKGKAVHRLYFAPYIMNNYFEIKTTDWDHGSNEPKISDSFDAVGTGVLFGWSFSFAKRMNLDVYTGGGIRKAIGAEVDPDDGVWDRAYTGITPRFGIDVGFLF